MKSPNKVTIGAVVALGCLLLLSLVLSNLDNKQSVSVNDVRDNGGDSIEAAVFQWRQLVNLGLEWINEADEGIRGTVKWQGEWVTWLSPEEAAGVLSSRLGLSDIEQENVQNHDTYYAVGNEAGMTSRLTVTSVKDGEYYVVLRMESSGLEALNELEKLQSVYGESLADEGVVIHWNAAVQGVLEEGIDISKLSDSMQELNLQLAENYKDDGTMSATYTAEGLPISVLSGSTRVGMQVAVHRNADTGKDEISIGSPLLTVEY